MNLAQPRNDAAPNPSRGPKAWLTRSRGERGGGNEPKTDGNAQKLRSGASRSEQVLRGLSLEKLVTTGRKHTGTRIAYAKGSVTYAGAPA